MSGRMNKGEHWARYPEGLLRNTLAIFSPKSIIRTKPASLIKNAKFMDGEPFPHVPGGLILSRLPLGPSSSLAKQALGRLAPATAAAFSCVIPVRSVKPPRWTTAGLGLAASRLTCWLASPPLPPLPSFLPIVLWVIVRKHKKRRGFILQGGVCGEDGDPTLGLIRDNPRP